MLSSIMDESYKPTIRRVVRFIQLSVSSTFTMTKSLLFYDHKCWQSLRDCCTRRRWNIWNYAHINFSVYNRPSFPLLCRLVWIPQNPNLLGIFIVLYFTVGRPSAPRCRPPLLFS